MMSHRYVMFSVDWPDVWEVHSVRSFKNITLLTQNEKDTEIGYWHSKHRNRTRQSAYPN